MNTTIIIADDADQLDDALADYGLTATAEAEYGDRVVEGTEVTMTDHQGGDDPKPCERSNDEFGDVELDAIGVSHVDLDTLGGVMALLGVKPKDDDFWSLAAFVDGHGVHRIPDYDPDEETLEKFNAYSAWAEENKIFSPRDGSADDVTEQVAESIETLKRILDGDEELLQAGREFVEEKEELNESSFVEKQGPVIVRVADGFTNHLYRTPSGELAEAVVSLRTDFHSATVSLAEPENVDASAREIVQSLWGDEAGGHDGIAGSPRDEQMGLDDLVDARDATVEALRDE
ncbi:MAG: hypothetical protein ABEJ02_04655 [Candidatus Paceibacteria bacterium]